MSPIKAIPNKPDIEVPSRSYKITFVGDGSSREVTIDSGKVPYGSTGLPGSILDIALGTGVVLEHICGGVTACSTCHVKITDGLESCNEPSEDELDQLDEAPDLSLHSWLSCQCVPNGSQDLVVEIPSWNKNLAREGQ